RLVIRSREKPVKKLAGFFSSGGFVWCWWCLSAYALRAKPTYADLRSAPHGANAKVIANERGGGMRPSGAHPDHEVTDPGCSATAYVTGEKKAARSAAFLT
ncbi:hypothetical protein, partial [Janthinobacterium tructae]|uniref:hypothetical protein n=1 Tax=Janthinobacterium tructae TaxID=2590869 RepID=UPI00249B6C8A